MKHLFLAPLAVSFGEVLHGVRLASTLVAAGDEVLFLASDELAPLLASAGLGHGRIDAVMPRLGQALLQVLCDDRWNSLVLVDLAAVYKVFDAYELDPSLLRKCAVPVVAFDCWNLAETGLRWDYGPEEYFMAKERLLAMNITRRLVPVPFARPDGNPFAYDALPEVAPLSESEREQSARLGLSATDRLILWPSAAWQETGAHQNPQRQRLAQQVPALLASYLGKLEPLVRVLHVGPRPNEAAAQTLGLRYRHLGQVSQPVFAKLLCCADLLLTCNAAATSLGSAHAASLPILLATNSFRGSMLKDVEKTVPQGLSATAKNFIEKVLPLSPFCVAPLNLSEFLSPVFQENPCYKALIKVELLCEDAFLGACRSLLFDKEAAAEIRRAQRLLCVRIAELPSAERLFRSLL